MNPKDPFYMHAVLWCLWCVFVVVVCVFVFVGGFNITFHLALIWLLVVGIRVFAWEGQLHRTGLQSAESFNHVSGADGAGSVAIVLL